MNRETAVVAKGTVLVVVERKEDEMQICIRPDVPMVYGSALAPEMHWSATAGCL